MIKQKCNSAVTPQNSYVNRKYCEHSSFSVSGCLCFYRLLFALSGDFIIL